MGRIVIACYTPKPGKMEALHELMKTHLPILRAQALATDRELIIMVAKDGTVVEVFEWVSAAAIAGAHENPEVQKMWAAYADVCDYTSIETLEEAKQLFSEFSPLT